LLTDGLSIGGSILGTAYDGLFNPVGLVQQSVQNGEPVVYVAMNYRVGIFGFAAAETLKRDKAENNGLRDQHLALKWIRDNISAFGGDPSRVTLFGQSFGGISVGLQLVAWGGKQEALFHKAIMTSGAISKDRNDAFAKNNTAAVADELKCTTEKGVVDNGVLACLRESPLADLLKANLDVAAKTKPSYGFAAFSPVVDGDMIPDQPKRLLEMGHFLRSKSRAPLPVAFSNQADI
jgi:carboxylesterase type B